MAHVTLHRTIEAPVSKVWAAWDDFASIDRFNPNLSKSYLLVGSQSTGLGATRQCDMTDGKNFVQERVIDYVPERRMTLDIFNGSLPLKRAIARIEMRATGPDRTELSFTMTFTPKMGLLGQLMVPLMKPQLRKALAALVDGNKAFVENGTVVARAA